MEKIADFPNEYEFEVTMYDHIPVKKIKCNERQITNDNDCILTVSNFDGVFRSTKFSIRKIADV